MIEHDESQPLDLAAEPRADELLARDRSARRVDQIADKPIRPPALGLCTAAHDRPRPPCPRHVAAIEAEMGDVEQPPQMCPSHGRVVPNRVEHASRESIALEDGRLEPPALDLGRVGVFRRPRWLRLGPLRRRRVERRWADASAARRRRWRRRFALRSTDLSLRLSGRRRVVRSSRTPGIELGDGGRRHGGQAQVANLDRNVSLASIAWIVCVH